MLHDRRRAARRPRRPPRRSAPRPSRARAARCRSGARARGRGPRRRRAPRARRPRRAPGCAIAASRSATRTLTSRCGQLAASRARSARSPPPSASSVSSALAMPSPEGTKPMSMMWPGLLAAERPAALAQLLEHVAVADLRRRDLDARLAPSPRGSRSSSSPSPRRRRPAGGRRARRCSAASAMSSSPSTTAPVRSTASTRSPSPSKAKPSVVAAVDDAPRPSASTCVEPQPALMLRPSGASAMTVTVGAEAAEDLGRDAVASRRWRSPATTSSPARSRPAKRVVQLAQVVLGGAVQRADAADAPPTAGRLALQAAPRSPPRSRRRA